MDGSVDGKEAVRAPAQGRPVSEEPRKPPWETALYQAVGKAQMEVKELKAENARLRARIADLTHRLENWQLRRDAWHRERNQLQDRISRMQEKDPPWVT